MIQVTTDNYKDKFWRLTHLYKIKSKNRGIIPFRLNPIQQQISKAISTQEPIRSIILKSRQCGVSTFFILYWLDDVLFRPARSCAVLCHKLESLSYLAGITKTALNHLPQSISGQAIASDSKTKIRFKNDSEIFLSLEIRGAALSDLHISEAGFCDDERIKATLAACSPLSNISIESTGNGFNLFWDLFMTAHEGKSDFKSLFFPWHDHYENQIPVDGLKPFNPSKEEQVLKLSQEQIHFYRQMKSKLRNSFRVEFPSDINDAFASTGRNFFDNKKILALSKQARKLDDEKPPIEKDERHIIWEQPTKGHYFVGGADVAEGIGGDYSVLKIICCTCKQEAMVYRWRCAVDEFGRVIDEYGRRFFNAFIAIERNNHGHAVLNALRDVHGYPSLYYEGTTEKKYGWATTSLSKPLMMDNLKECLEGSSETTEEEFEPEFVIRDHNLLAECLSFQQDGKKLNAAQGKYDDDIVASSIAVQMYMRRGRKFDPSKIIIGKQLEAGKLFTIPMESVQLFHGGDTNASGPIFY